MQPWNESAHESILQARNNHHMVEALFKAFGKALDEGSSFDPRITDIL
ncbi:MAG: hypothetical protein V8R80_02165 [Eubacterium sp.]